MPLTKEQKKEVGERLLRGEDVELTLEAGDMMSGEAGGDTGDSQFDEGLHHPHSHDTMAGGGNMNTEPQGQAIDANIIIESLKRRIGELTAQYEFEIALRDAIIQQNAHVHEGDVDG